MTNRNREAVEAAKENSDDSVNATSKCPDTTTPVNFIGPLRGENVELPGVRTHLIQYTKRDRKELKDLRNEFNRKKRAEFVKELAGDTGKLGALKEAGLTDSDIKKMEDGRIPTGWQVHHKLPIDDGGDNSLSNLVLMKNEPAHKVITNRQNRIVRDLKEGDTRMVDFPIPDGFVYPPKPGMVISPPKY